MIGTSLSHFKITAKLGEGGMGEVYRAEDGKLDRGVAIKLLPEAVASDPDRLSRFEREAKVLASLNHPHIAGIHQVEEADGVFFLVMELVEGEDLKQRIDRGALSLDEALSIASQIAEALEAAHDRGIVHRDLKPANIKITPEGTVKVLDFGLAKALGNDAAESGPGAATMQSPTMTAGITGAGVLLGTAAYMAPEQARGQAVDRRADIWAFGVVLFEMLTGRMLYAGDTVSDTLAGILAREPKWEDLSADTPRPIRRLLERCLEKELRQRLQAIGEARITIERFLQDPSMEEPATAVAEQPRSAPGRRLLPWALVAVLLAALGATFFGWIGGDDPVAELPIHSSLELAEGLTLHRGYGSPVVISPAGDLVAHTFQGGADQELHLRALDQWSSSVLVAGQDQDRPYQPFFSPDGDWLGFVTPSSLRKVPVRGGTPIKLCDLNLGRGASWSPDGTIVFAGTPGGGLSRVSAAGGQPEPLTELDLDKNEVTHRWPQVLRGGEAVLFTAHSSDTGYDGATIEVLEIASGERREIHRGGTYARYVDSGHLIYMNQGSLFAMPFDLDTLQATGSAAPVIQGVGSSGEGGAYYSVSNDGTLVFVPGETGSGAQLKALRVDRQGRIETLLEEKRNYRNPRYSPDGTRLAVEIETSGNSDIWVLDLERGVPTRLTFHETFDGSPIWSPDGEFLAFASARGEGTQNIYRKPADGSGDVELLVESERLVIPWSWSPDGDRIALLIQNPETNIDLAFASVADGTIEPFQGSKFIEYAPVFSPDGRWIAYGSNESGGWEAYVRPVDGSRGKWQISAGGGVYPVWSRGGSEIFLGREGGGVQSVSVDTSGGSFRVGRPQELFTGPFANLAGASNMYDVAPDGQHFVLFQGEIDESSSGHEHLRLVSNWFVELERTFAK